MYTPHPLDIEQFRTETLVVWIRRPDPHHANWWIGYYSTDEGEVKAWDWAIQAVFKQSNATVFHQGAWPVDHRERHPDCDDMFAYRCPGVAQAWEVWLGCSRWALHFPDASLDEIRECGDPALEQVLEAVQQIREKVKEW
jgi:hypothetical protein